MSDWLGALIGAAERGLYTAFGKNPPKDNQILKTVNWAKQAGIHPIYALGGGFNSGFAGPTINWGDGAIGTGIGDAISGLYDEIQAGREDREFKSNQAREGAERRAAYQRDEFNQAKRDLETKRFNDAQIKLIEAQTVTENARLAAMLRGGSTGGNVSDPNQPIRLGPLTLDTTAAGMSPSQTIQNEYGDIVENLYGGGKLILDIIRNLSTQEPQNEVLRRYGGY